MEMKDMRSEVELVEVGIAESGGFLQTVLGREDEPAMVGYAEYGVPWRNAACQSKSGLEDVSRYRDLVAQPQCSAWMDNTTLVTAQVLMSPAGPEAMTPLTVWDLATFVRACVSYERVYHHEHPSLDDDRINGIFGDEFLVQVPLPLRSVPPGHILPDPWDGAHRFMCDVWDDAHSWIRRLHGAVGTEGLDGKQIMAITQSWRAALQRPELSPQELVDFEELDHRWGSPSNQLLVDTVNITDVDDTRIYLDPTEGFQALAQRGRELGLHDKSIERRSDVLSDLNLRAYVNQRVAEFFALPYASAAGRIPFRKHLYDRSIRVQQQLTVANVIDSRYGELSLAAHLRLPVFLALVMQDSERPENLWTALASLREKAASFRAHRTELDQELERGNLKEARKIGKALHTSIDGLLAVAGKAVSGASTVVLEEVSKGDLPGVAMGISAAVAATKNVLKSSFADRLIWRLRRPHLLWINDIVDQAERLTEAMPDFARIWGIPPNRQAVFAQRFRGFAQLVQ